MNDKLDSGPQMEDIELGTRVLDLPENKRATICQLIVVGKSFEVVVTGGTTAQFLQVLDELYEDEASGVPAYAEALSREIPTVQIIGSIDFRQRLFDFATEKAAKRLHTPWDYAANVHTLNVWVNPDYLRMEGDDAITFSVMAKYAQNLYLFDHEIEFGALSRQLQTALGEHSYGRHTIGQK